MKETITSVFTPNKTSAQLLVDYARARLLNDSQSLDSKSQEENLQRFLLLFDLYIKARSYAMINKVFFLLAVVMGLMVLFWPSVAIVSKDLGFDKEFLKSAVIQTTITGLAALTFAVYSHYKKRQMFTENLMRHTLFSEERVAEVKARVIQEMERIDSGFGFSHAVLKKSESEGSKSGA